MKKFKKVPPSADFFQSKNPLLESEPLALAYFCPTGLGKTIISAEMLNCRVRNGNGCDHLA